MLLQAACGGPSSSADRSGGANASIEAGQASAPALARANVDQPSAAPFWDAQKLIRSADLRVEVKDVQNAMRSADSLVKLRGALIADSKLGQDADGRHQAELVIRVPSERFAATLAALRQLGEMRDESVTTEDVTKEYTDLVTRLSVKEQAVTRLRALLDNRTAKLADVLEVERELTRTVTELEQMKGEQRYYDQQVALSSIRLTLVDHAASSAGQITGPIGDAFRNSFKVVGTSLSAMIYLIAIVLPWGVLAALVWWIVVMTRTRIRTWMRSTGPQKRDYPPKPPTV